MTIFKVVFTNKNAPGGDETFSPQNYTYRIEAATLDEAVGLAQIEFTQKMPQLAHADYVPHAGTDDNKDSRAVHAFAKAGESNPDP